MAQFPLNRASRSGRAIPWKPKNPIFPSTYLQILFDDLGYDRLHRNDRLSLEFNRPIKFLDELDEQETKQMIRTLRVQKYGEEKP